MNTTRIRSTLLALLLASPGSALAAPEVEANNDPSSAQMLTITDITVDGRNTTGAIVEGVIGVTSGPVVPDLDFFSFSGKAGDLVTVDIDGGIGGARNVDTRVAVFGPAPTYAVLRQENNGSPVDPGSTSTMDARIVDVKLLADGVYTVGVTGTGNTRVFTTGGKTTSNTVAGSGGNGDYTLIISGVTAPPSVQIINIDIKPGSDEVAPINPKARGRVPVALLGSSEFSVEDVDTASLTFGHSGNEESLAKCGSPDDVNGDAFPDLVCHFENQAAQFQLSDNEAILRGTLDSGMKIEGRGWLKVGPKAAE